MKLRANGVGRTGAGWRVGRGVAAAWAAASIVGLGLACGSSGGGGVGSGPDGGHDGSARADASRADGSGRDSGKGHPTDAPGHLGSDAPGGSDAAADAACAAHTTPATVIPAYLVFVMDRSDSMNLYGKWPACSAALESFFSDPSTKGIYSSLTFMPYVAPDAADGHGVAGYSCVPADYVKPAVPMTALPSSAFAPVIEAEKLKSGTPTTPALEGATRYAAAVQADHPGAKVFIVLATDGYPAGCAPKNTVADVAKAAAVADKTYGIPVYVIGVGPDNGTNAGIAHLDEVAEAGATGSPFFIPTEADGGDAGVTEQAFLAAVHAIQGKLGCTYAIPEPPAGQTLDYDKVNVVLSSNGTDATLPYSADCSDPNGWRYEEAADGGAPERIALCLASCKAARTSSSTGSVSVELGCKTTGGIPK